ncbi:succinate dehydrogenase cytochrome b subunit [Kocuria rosea]|uniref:Succinate dehydrogenase cytochrome b subunit n=1 Tax=Kocuria rosea TaxID=1275 RepID=A0A4V3B3D8_KOCRO|nr:succinate dehydrogenase cytochrome b subunit [Kocuria rosea]TDL44380.1 succinate dehydrogenase cytochrome b subunit [Kocuria rosea]
MAQSTARPRPGAPHGHDPDAVRPHRPSNVTAKLIMAVTGGVFAAYVLVHMIGNLKIYQGAEHFNDYAHWLRTAFEPVLPSEGLLWIVRGVLLLCLVAHVYCSTVLVVRARRARGAHRRRGLGREAFTARTMPATGVILLLFVVFHVLDLTLGAQPVAPGDFRAATATSSDAYANLVASFARPPVALFYVLAMLALAAHLVHGIVSMVVDLGIAGGPRFWRVLRLVALVTGLGVALGNITIPVAVLTGGLT